MPPSRSRRPQPSSPSSRADGGHAKGAVPEASAREGPRMEAPQSTGNRALTGRLSPEADRERGAEERRARPAGGWLVEDGAGAVGPGQMRRSEFLAALKAEVCSTADEGLAPAGRTSQGCPWIQYWFDLYAGRSAAHLERAVRRFAPEGASARDAHEVVRVLAARVRRSVDVWARTGEVGGLPEGVPMEAPGAGMGVLFSARPGGASASASPEAIGRQLGPGEALEGGVRSRMESAFGTSFEQVRAHTDTDAAGLAGSMNARAFTVGPHVAFGSGEYQPGTLLGDALIAHELAHVVQQSGAPASRPTGDAAQLDRDADHAAMGAVSALWGPLPDRPRGGPLPSRARPSRHAGLHVQRCSRPQGPPLDRARLEALTPWQLRELSAEELERVDAGTFTGPGPRPADYARARRLARAVLRFDIDTPPGPGRDPSSGGCSGPSEMQILDRNLSQILASNGIAGRLSGRPLERENGQPSLRGRVRIATREGLAAAMYRLELHVSGISASSGRADDMVRELWTANGITPAADARITPQERRIALYALYAAAPPIPNGLYQVQEDRIYIPEFADLHRPEGAFLARHETAHLLGGRERTRTAFMRRFGSSWMEWWQPFEEGMAELVTLESLPPGQTAPPPPVLDLGGGSTVVGERYEGYVRMMRNITRNPADRELMFSAYFSGNIPERVFELLARERGVALPPAP